MEQEKNIIDELNEKAKRELENAKVNEWGTPIEDVQLVLGLKVRFENTLDNLNKQLETSNKVIKNNKLIINLFEKDLLRETDNSLIELIKTNLNELKKVETQNADYVSKIPPKIDIVNKSLEILQPVIKEDNKAYFSDTAIILSKIIMSL